MTYFNFLFFCFQFSNGMNRESTCLQGPDCFMVSEYPSFITCAVLQVAVCETSLGVNDISYTAHYFSSVFSFASTSFLYIQSTNRPC
jgi:hypothetical protein